MGVSPNQGDTSVTCFKGRDVEQQPWAGCDYALNVTRGWYDLSATERATLRARIVEAADAYLAANETTINWNAPLAWVAAFLDEQQSPQTQR